MSTPTQRTPATSGGRPATEETIQRLAEQADTGYDPARLRHVPGRPSMGSSVAPVIPVRLEPELIDALRRRGVRDPHPSAAGRIAIRRKGAADVAWQAPGQHLLHLSPLRSRW